MSARAYDPERLRTLAVSEAGFVFDPRTGHSYSVNATGMAVLAGMKDGLEAAEIAERLRGGFDCGGQPVEDEVAAFFALAREYGLLDRAAAASGEGRVL